MNHLREVRVFRGSYKNLRLKYGDPSFYAEKSELKF